MYVRQEGFGQGGCVVPVTYSRTKLSLTVIQAYMLAYIDAYKNARSGRCGACIRLEAPAEPIFEEIRYIQKMNHVMVKEVMTWR